MSTSTKTEQLSQTSPGNDIELISSHKDKSIQKRV